MMSPVSERLVDVGVRLDECFDRDFRKMVKAVVGGIVGPEVVAMVSRSSEAASVRGSSTADLLLGHV